MAAEYWGKGFNEYMAEVDTGVDLIHFGADLRSFVSERLTIAALGGKPATLVLSDSQIKSIYEIADEYLRQKKVQEAMARDKVKKDWQRRSNMMNATDKKLTALISSLRSASNADWPITRLLSEHVASEVDRLRSQLVAEFDDIQIDARASETSARMLHAQTLMREFVMELRHFIDHAYTGLTAKQRNFIIGGTLYAAGLSDKSRDQEDLMDVVPEKVSRSKTHLKKLRGRGVDVAFRKVAK